MGTISWVCVEAALSSRNGPDTLNCAGVDEWDDIYVPAALAGDERRVLLLARSAAEPMAYFGESGEPRLFVRSAWLCRNFPESAALANEMELGILAWLEGYSIALAPELEAELRAGQRRAQAGRVRIAA